MKNPLLRFVLLFTCTMLSFGSIRAQDQDKAPIPFLENESPWAETVLQSLSPEERIAQLIMIPVYSNRDQAYIDSIASLIEEYKVGGLIFFQGGPGRQAAMTNRYQKLSKVPMMISIDAEWGLGMRLDSTMSFPYQMALGGVEDENLLFEMGREIARHCKRIGVNVNFAPVVDINNNANNPVIGFRSFGEDKHNVATKAIAYMKGMQEEHVLANAKHFPGHGDTNVDSHVGLPQISFSRLRLDSVELYPFRKLMDEGLGSVMVAHMNIPVLDNTPNLASTLSKPIVTDLLKGELGYEGLVFTDALNMQGVAKYYPPGIVDVKALLAGNDMLLNTMDVKTTIEQVKLAIANGEITQEEVDRRVLKVLRAKDWQGLSNWKPIEMKGIYEDLNSSASMDINRKLVEASVTVLRNKNELLPIQHLAEEKLAYVALGTDKPTAFQEGLSRYVEADQFLVPKNMAVEQLADLLDSLKGYTKVIVGLHELGLKASVKNFGITAEMNLFLKNLIDQQETIVTVFGNVYSLDKIENLQNAAGLITTYQESALTQDIASQIIFGGIGASGKLPVTINSHFKINDGIKTQGGLRFSYVEPERLGIAAAQLQGISEEVHKAISEKAIPGASVLVAKDGKVFYQEAFGYHTYKEENPVKVTDLYDLASVTKISTSLAALMKLQGEGKFDVDKTLGDYLPLAQGSNKENLKYRDILTHQAGLTAWIAFWQSTVKKNGQFKWFTFKDHPSKRFPIQVADHLYIHRNYADKIYKEIMKSPVSGKHDYVYSDLSFILAPLVVKEISGENFETYLQEGLYRHLGASTLTFNPYRHYAEDRIVPTEYDSLFRGQLLDGTVHDEGAAMLGGVSGHAGLFGDANDLAKLMQLYLQDGEYAKEELIKGNTVSEYSKCQFCPDNYRALGFDRPRKPGDPNGNSAPSAPASSFGHTGFTGTYAWMDPENGLVYIFLSNRVHPTRENTKLYQLNTRTNVLEVVYQALNH